MSGIKNKLIETYEKEVNTVLYQEYLKQYHISFSDKNTVNDLQTFLFLTDSYTSFHSQNVSFYSVLLATELGLDEDMIEIIRIGALLHDIGKLIVPCGIITKPAKLTGLEYEIIKNHPIIGEQLLSNEEHEIYCSIIRSHHERYDGKGYPDGLSGNDIPLFARIISLADSFDAMTSFRTYNHPKTCSEALEEIQLQSGKQFDPILVKHFINAINKVNLNLSNLGLVLQKKAR